MLTANAWVDESVPIFPTDAVLGTSVPPLLVLVVGSIPFEAAPMTISVTKESSDDAVSDDVIVVAMPSVPMVTGGMEPDVVVTSEAITMVESAAVSPLLG